MTINERIALIISTLKMNPNSFSNAIGVNSTIVHNIIKGRNAPSFEILHKIALSFDDINMNWLILEKGDMLDENGMFKHHITADPVHKDRSKSVICEKCQMKDELISSLKREVETLSRYNSLLESK